LCANEINDLADCSFWKSAISAANTELNDVFTHGVIPGLDCRMRIVCCSAYSDEVWLWPAS